MFCILIFVSTILYKSLDTNRILCYNIKCKEKANQRRRERPKMGKNVYSLVLSDDVVAAVDRMAYMKGLSRSGMINELLASAVSYTTPEMWIRTVISKIEGGLGSGTFIQMQSGANAYSMRSALAYKYNPSLRFSVELYRNRERADTVGEIKISLRSRSAELILLLIKFFGLWQTVESAYLPSVEYLFNDGKIIRSLKPSDPEASAEETGDSIGRFAVCVNKAIEAYFTSYDRESDATEKRLREICAEYYKSGKITV